MSAIASTADHIDGGNSIQLKQDSLFIPNSSTQLDLHKRNGNVLRNGSSSSALDHHRLNQYASVDHSRIVVAAPGTNITAMYRNSSTVEKPRAGLSLVSNIENSKITANSTSLMEPLTTSHINNYASADLQKALH